MRVNVPMTVALDVGAPTSCVPDPVAELRGQPGRLLEIVAIGPLMIWGGAKAGGLGGAALVVAGMFTMFSNAREYSRVRALSAFTPRRLAVPPPQDDGLDA